MINARTQKLLKAVEAHVDEVADHRQRGRPNKSLRELIETALFDSAAANPQLQSTATKLREFYASAPASPDWPVETVSAALIELRWSARLSLLALVGYLNSVDEALDMVEVDRNRQHDPFYRGPAIK